MPKLTIVDVELATKLLAYRGYRDGISALEKEVKVIQPEIKQRVQTYLSDSDAGEMLVTSSELPTVKVRLRSQERRSISREKLLELGVPLATVDAATSVSSYDVLTVSVEE